MPMKESKAVVGVRPQSKYSRRGSNCLIGSKFPSKKGSILEVVGRLPDGRYILVCSICSQDIDLYPLGQIAALKGNLIKGGIPCRCSTGNTRLSSSQVKILCERVLQDKGASFIGFVGEYKNTSTKAIVKLESGVIIETLTCTQIMKLKGEIPYRVPDNIKDAFISTLPALTNVSVIKRITRRGKPYIRYQCSVCSSDEYVIAGVCTGIFETARSCMKKGVVSCRCSRSYKPTKQVREFQIKKELLNRSGSFLSWCTEGWCAKSRFLWKCREGHLVECNVNNFIYGKRGCPSCSGSNGNGFYYKRVGELDHLYIAEVRDHQGELLPYFKVGRSFTPETRMVQHKNKTGYSFNILLLVTATHTEIYNYEQATLLEFKGNRVEGSWSKELLDLKILDEVIMTIGDHWKDKQLERFSR